MELNELLNERTAEQGMKWVKCPLWEAIFVRASLSPTFSLWPPSCTPYQFHAIFLIPSITYLFILCNPHTNYFLLSYRTLSFFLLFHSTFGPIPPLTRHSPPITHIPPIVYRITPERALPYSAISHPIYYVLNHDP